MRVILWNWEIGQVKLSFQSGHRSNVFQAKIMPYTDDRSIVTCAADGQVFYSFFKTVEARYEMLFYLNVISLKTIVQHIGQYYGAIQES